MQNSRLTFCCDMAKSRDILIYVDAPGRRYFAKQNFSAEITHAEVCKIKTHNISNLRIYAYHLCNKMARKTLRKAVFCTAKSRKHGMKRRPSRRQKAVNRIAKDGLLQDERPQTALSKTANGYAEGRFLPIRQLFHAKPLTFSRWHIGIVSRRYHCFLTLRTVCADRA